jgi:hypothetical protein
MREVRLEGDLRGLSEGREANRLAAIDDQRERELHFAYLEARTNGSLDPIVDHLLRRGARPESNFRAVPREVRCLLDGSRIGDADDDLRPLPLHGVPVQRELRQVRRRESAGNGKIQAIHGHGKDAALADLGSRGCVDPQLIRQEARVAITGALDRLPVPGHFRPCVAVRHHDHRAGQDLAVAPLRGHLGDGFRAALLPLRDLAADHRDRDLKQQHEDTDRYQAQGLRIPQPR